MCLKYVRETDNRFLSISLQPQKQCFDDSVNVTINKDWSKMKNCTQQIWFGFLLLALTSEQRKQKCEDAGDRGFH